MFYMKIIHYMLDKLQVLEVLLVQNAVRNVAVGKEALNNIYEGDDNIGVGYRALRDPRNSSRNIAIGTDCMRIKYDGNDCIAIGYDVLGGTSLSNDLIYIGNYHLTNLKVGIDQ